jgi:hypothetical protein
MRTNILSGIGKGQNSVSLNLILEKYNGNMGTGYTLLERETIGQIL